MTALPQGEAKKANSICTSLGCRLRQNRRLQRPVSYLHIVYDPLISEQITLHQILVITIFNLYEDQDSTVFVDKISQCLCFPNICTSKSSLFKNKTFSVQKICIISKTWCVFPWSLVADLYKKRYVEKNITKNGDVWVWLQICTNWARRVTDVVRCCWGRGKLLRPYVRLQRALQCDKKINASCPTSLASTS